MSTHRFEMNSRLAYHVTVCGIKRVIRIDVGTCKSLYGDYDLDGDRVIKYYF